jgi:hypothetical protein
MLHTMSTIPLTTRLFYNTTTGQAWYTIEKRYSRILTAKDTKGYLHARIGQKKHRLHQIIYRHFHGEIPTGAHIDHIDCDKRNNRVENLRAVNPLVNARNRIPPKNASGYPNVRWCKKHKSWKAHIESLGVVVWSGQSQDARALYNRFLEAKAKHHGPDSLRHYPGYIDTRRYAVAKQQRGGDGRGAVRITKPNPNKWDHWFRVVHNGKSIFRTKDYADAQTYAANLRNSLDNAN